MENYNDLLLEIESIKNEPVNTKRSVRLTLIKAMIQTLALSIRAQKLYRKHNINIEGFEEYALIPFFGNNDIKDHEIKLKELRKKLREISAKDKTASD